MGNAAIVAAKVRGQNGLALGQEPGARFLLPGIVEKVRSQIFDKVRILVGDIFLFAQFPGQSIEFTLDRYGGCLNQLPVPLADCTPDSILLFRKSCANMFRLGVFL